MVERVARGRIMVPAAAAIGAVSAGLLLSEPAAAGGRDSTLQMRVQVVDSCQIRLAPGGRLEQTCGSIGPSSLGVVRISELLEVLERGLAGRGVSVALGASISVEPQDRTGAANRRARGIAERIAQRVRFITLTY